MTPQSQKGGFRDNSNSSMGMQNNMYSNQQSFSVFQQQRSQMEYQNATSQDMDMYKRLKRLEKFDSQARDKAKQSKPKLISNSANSFIAS